MSEGQMESKGVRILCIEDNPVNWRLVQRLLAQAGHEMHWADEGLRGFDMALELRPDLILLDINLPGLSGFEIATKFRQSAELKRTIIVALTAKTLKSDRETALVAGCDGFISKPIDPFCFVKQVEDFLKGRKEAVDEDRKEEALQRYNAQTVERVEEKYRETLAANTQLLEANQQLEEAKAELERRNRSLSRIVALGQGLLGEHDEKALLRRVLEHVLEELPGLSICAFRLHESRGYWEGMRLQGRAWEVLPVLSVSEDFSRHLGGFLGKGALSGDEVKASRIWEQGIALGYWGGSDGPGLLVQEDRKSQEAPWGFWAFAREGGEALLPLEREMLVLHASLAQVSQENAQLIRNLDDKTRALGESFESLNQLYQDLQVARSALSLQERQGLLEDLFRKFNHRLQDPVRALDREVRALEAGEPGLSQASRDSLQNIQGALVQVDGLLKALARRVDKGRTEVPEVVHLHDLIQQELELLRVEGVVPGEVRLGLRFEAKESRFMAVYRDFADLLQDILQHATTQFTEGLSLRTWEEGGRFWLEVADEGGPIPDPLLPAAFEPFGAIPDESVLGVRIPGAGLPRVRQILQAYHGEVVLLNEGEGTVVRVCLPMD